MGNVSALYLLSFNYTERSALLIAIDISAGSNRFPVNDIEKGDFNPGPTVAGCCVAFFLGKRRREFRYL